MSQKIRYPKITKAQIMEAWNRLAKECKRTGQNMPLEIFPTRVEDNRLIGYIIDQPDILYETDSLVSYRSYCDEGIIKTLSPRQIPATIWEFDTSTDFFNTINPPESDAK